MKHLDAKGQCRNNILTKDETGQDLYVNYYLGWFFQQVLLHTVMSSWLTSDYSLTTYVCIIEKQPPFFLRIIISCLYPLSVCTYCT